jgi:hypothetical protein
MTAVPDSSSRRLPVLGSRYLSKPGAMSIKDMIATPARVKLAHRLESALSISMSPAPRLAINFDIWTISTGICMHLPDALPTSSAKGASKSRYPLRPLQPSRHLPCSTNTSSFAQTNPASPPPSISLKFKALARGKWPSSVLLEGSKPLRHTPVSRRRWLSRRQLIAQH